MQIQNDVISEVIPGTGLIIAKRLGNEIFLGYALRNPTDAWDEEVAHTVAWRRLMSSRYRISVRPTKDELTRFIEGSGRIGREGRKYHPIREVLIEPMIALINKASDMKHGGKLPSGKAPRKQSRSARPVADMINRLSKGNRFSAITIS